LPELDQHHRAVQLAQQALQSLASQTFASTAVVNDDDELGFPVRKQSQKERKKAKRGHTRSSTLIDARPFDNLHVSVPESEKEALLLAGTLLREQKSILEDYLTFLRKPALYNDIKKNYIPDITVAAEQVMTNGAEDEGDSSIGHTQELPAAYPLVQPMKAALYFESAEGFGEWRILISTRADRNLREARKKNPTLFKIIIKKIKSVLSVV